MMGNGSPHLPGAVLRKWRTRAGRTRDWLAHCILTSIDRNSPLARRYRGATGERDLAADIGVYEDFDIWSVSTALLESFLDACVDCLSGGKASLIDRATLAMALSQGILPDEPDPDEPDPDEPDPDEPDEDPPDGMWEEGDDDIG